jgi:hypothetical protein
LARSDAERLLHHGGLAPTLISATPSLDPLFDRHFPNNGFQIAPPTGWRVARALGSMIRLQ